jgi:hypothetical protein
MALGMLFLAAPAAGVSAQRFVCNEFVVNEHEPAHQSHPKVAATASGRFAVVWDASAEGASGIFSRIFDTQGVSLGPDVNLAPQTAQFPAIASDAAGNFVVVWEIGGNIFGQRLNASGLPQGPVITIKTSTAQSSARPAVGADAAGNFVVVWEDEDTDDIEGRRFNAAGMPLGPEFQVDTAQDLSRDASISMQASGEFVVGWNGGSFDIPTARRFDASGAPLGDSFVVWDGPGFHLTVQVAHGPNGDFVAFLNGVEGPSGRVYDSAGNPRGTLFPIGTPGDAGTSIAGDPVHGYVVTWERTPGRGVMGRRLDPAGAPMGGEFFMNTLGGNGFPGSVAATPGGRYVAVWEGRDSSSTGIIGHLDCAVSFYAIPPCRVADTRLPSGTPLAANSTRLFPVAGNCGIPADARAVALNATAVNPTNGGDLRLYPAGGPAPLASMLNFTEGRNRAGNAIVALGTGGQAAVQCDMPAGSTGITHLVLDAFGYFQ